MTDIHQDRSILEELFPELKGKINDEKPYESLMYNK